MFLTLIAIAENFSDFYREPDDNIQNSYKFLRQQKGLVDPAIQETYTIMTYFEQDDFVALLQEVQLMIDYLERDRAIGMQVFEGLILEADFFQEGSEERLQLKERHPELSSLCREFLLITDQLLSDLELLSDRAKNEYLKVKQIDASLETFAKILKLSASNKALDITELRPMIDRALMPDISDLEIKKDS